MVLPRRWTAEELEAGASSALAAFVSRRFGEGTGPYEEAFTCARGAVKRLFAATSDLTDLGPTVLQGEPELIEAARFLGGPPLSQDDLNTLSGGKVCQRRTVTDDLAARAITALLAFLDPFRCTWLHTGKKPTQTQIRTAVDWTASLWAVEMCRTRRRGEESAQQEQTVAQLLVDSGLGEASGLRSISSLDELPRRQFTREIVIGTAKADLAVRLADGRLLAIECKASNSAINSVKRLNRETVGKAEGWRTLYGRQVVTAAVLSGVFKVSNLVDAQQACVSIFWQHELGPLLEFLSATHTT